MPRSKRDKKVSLTKTQKHGKDWKKNMVKEVREAVEKYSRIYVFRAEGMRISGLTELRKKFRKGRVFLGKNKVLALSLGKDDQSELMENLHCVSDRLKGECGLLLSDDDKADILKYFDDCIQNDYARSGSVATETVKLDAGDLEQFDHSLEPRLRALGVPTVLKKGVIKLTRDFVVCKEGDNLTPEQCKILKLLEIPMATLKFTLDSMWTKPNDFIQFDVDPPEHGINDNPPMSSDEEDDC